MIYRLNNILMLRKGLGDVYKRLALSVNPQPTESPYPTSPSDYSSHASSENFSIADEQDEEDLAMERFVTPTYSKRIIGGHIDNTHGFLAVQDRLLLHTDKHQNSHSLECDLLHTAKQQSSHSLECQQDLPCDRSNAESVTSAYTHEGFDSSSSDIANFHLIPMKVRLILHNW